MSTECSKYCRGCQVETNSLRESLKRAEQELETYKRANEGLKVSNQFLADENERLWESQANDADEREQLEEENETLRRGNAQFSKNETIFIREEARRTRERDKARAENEQLKEWRRQDDARLAAAEEGMNYYIELWKKAGNSVLDLQARLSATEAELADIKAWRDEGEEGK